MLIDERLAALIGRFQFSGVPQTCDEIQTGHINHTYRLGFRQGDGADRDYILQNINTFAFKQPDALMENVLLVTEHLRAALVARGEDPANRVLRVIPTLDGAAMLRDDAGNCWRAYDFIAHAVSVNQVENPAQFREIGRAFGEFQRMLADFPISKLHDTIPDFHNTRKRLEAFERAVKADVAGRASEAEAEIAFCRARKAEMCRIVEMIEAGEIPLRVTHNDTKINNVMLDVDTKRALCVIDLDTVMAGSALYDFGDAIRFGASTALEDEPDLSKVWMDLALYRAFTDGFVSETAGDLTDAELDALPLGALVMTFEVGLRFLTDYLERDVYFRTEYPGHNLVRARNQFKLVADMEAKRGEMEAATREMIKKYRSL